MSERILDAFRAIIRAEFPRLLYLGVHEYQVTTATEETFDGRSMSPGLPDLVGIPIGSLPGAKVKAAPGARAFLSFLNVDPGKPFVLAWDSTPPESLSVPLLDVGVEPVSLVRAPEFQAWIAETLLPALAASEIVVEPPSETVATTLLRGM